MPLFFMAEAALDLRNQKSAQLKEIRQNTRHKNYSEAVSGTGDLSRFNESANSTPKSKAQSAATLKEQRAQHRRANRATQLPDNIGSNTPVNSDRQTPRRGKVDTVKRAMDRGDKKRKSVFSAFRKRKKKSKKAKEKGFENMRAWLDRWFASEFLATFAGDPVPLILLHVRTAASMSFGKKIPFLREFRFTETSILKSLAPKSVKMSPPTFTPVTASLAVITLDLLIPSLIIDSLYVLILPMMTAYNIIGGFWISVFMKIGSLAWF